MARTGRSHQKRFREVEYGSIVYGDEFIRLDPTRIYERFSSARCETNHLTQFLVICFCRLVVESSFGSVTRPSGNSRFSRTMLQSKMALKVGVSEWERRLMVSEGIWRNRMDYGWIVLIHLSMVQEVPELHTQVFNAAANYHATMESFTWIIPNHSFFRLRGLGTSAPDLFSDLRLWTFQQLPQSP